MAPHHILTTNIWKGKKREGKRSHFTVWIRPQKSCPSWRKSIKKPLNSDQVCFYLDLLQKQLINHTKAVALGLKCGVLSPLPLTEGVLKVTGAETGPTVMCMPRTVVGSQATCRSLVP